jgi:cell division initiation protein
MHHSPFRGNGFTADQDGLPGDVRDPEFPLALRGYDRDAVDAYVMRVNDALDELEAMRSPEAAVKRALERVGEETRGVLERAHETAEQITARSRAQADDRLQAAKREASDAIAAAEARVRDLDADAEVVWQDRQKLLDEVRVIATDLLAVADAAAERYPVENPEGPPPGQLTEVALSDSLPEQPFDVEAVAEEDVMPEPEAAAPDAEAAEPEPDIVDLPPPDPADAASIAETDELPPDRE